MTADLALTESPTLRAAYSNRVDVLTEVDPVTLLADGTHVSTEMVAAYFGVSIKTIESLVFDNRPELEANEYRVISAAELASFKKASGIRSRARSFALFTERTVLLVAMLLRDSEKARAIRTRLLDGAQGRTAQPREVSRRELAQWVIEAEERAELEAARADAAEERAAALEPLAEQALHHRAADGLRTVADFANTVQAWATPRGIRVRHRDVWEYLAHLGLIIRGNTIRHNHPTAVAVARGYLRAKETVITRTDGTVTVSVSPRLTPRGEGYVWDRITRDLSSSTPATPLFTASH